MPPQSSDLAVRRHERYACALPARITVAPEDDQAVRPGRSAGDADGSIPATVVDCSLGGLGLHCTLFFPVGCHLRISFSVGAKPITAKVRAQRVVMTDRKPTYYIGGALDESDAAVQDTMREALDALKAAGAKAVTEKPGA